MLDSPAKRVNGRDWARHDHDSARQGQTSRALNARFAREFLAIGRIVAAWAEMR
jgi:hypothetical protein